MIAFSSIPRLITAQVPDPDYETIENEEGGFYPSYYPDVPLRPEIGMAVHVFYDTSGNETSLHCLPTRVPNPSQELSLETRRAVSRIDGIDRPEDVIGEGVITAVRYKPGRSGKLYPYVSVEINP